MTRARSALWIGVAGAAVLGLTGARHAQAQGSGASGTKPPPVRATSTVEVIDTGRGVDDIISRVRAQQQRLSTTGSAASEKGAAGAQAGRGQAQGGQGTTDSAPAREADELRAERPERPHPERDRRDVHRKEREAARRGQLERARDAKRP
jgi:hypothetical protein